MHTPTTIAALVRQATRLLETEAVDNPALSARVLVGAALGLSRTQMVLAHDRAVSPMDRDAALGLVARRAAGEPVAYILGEKEFFGRPFTVTRDVLIPRPETEHVVEEALARVAPGAPLRLADLGTGSGILAVTLAAHLAHARCLAVDTSAAALAVARGNAVRHGVADRIVFARADFAALPLPTPGTGRCGFPGLDLVVANPPYVEPRELPLLSREVRDFEPHGALFPARPCPAHVPEGLQDVDAIAEEALRVLRPGGVLLMEIGCTQGVAVQALFRNREGWADVAVLPDLAGLDRVVVSYSQRKLECCAKDTSGFCTTETPQD
ncbi:MAG: peptide chain release factor N(5)-glutamine methyltransferase [Desulfovibrionaceae bacterium]